MTRPLTSKVLLVQDRRSESVAPGTTAVRRYRLARLRLDGREIAPEHRFEHLKRLYD